MQGMMVKYLSLQKARYDMRTKYLIIYLAVGAAFLAVSFWAFLSNGKSAKAIRAKYMLGGILLTSWAMFSAASCDGPFHVTCYEPVVTCYDVPAATDILSVTVKDYGGTRLKSGDVLVIQVERPSFSSFRYWIKADTQEAPLLQSGSFTLATPENGQISFAEVTLSATDYKGAATVTIAGLYKDSEGNEKESEIGKASITIL